MIDMLAAVKIIVHFLYPSVYFKTTFKYFPV